MPSVLRAALRVLAGVVVGSLLLFAAIFVCVRQPTWTTFATDRTIHASPSILRDHVVFLTTTVRPRSADRPENLDAAADYIRRAFVRAGARVSIEEFSARHRTYRNVVADFGPAQPSRIIVGAHYDAFAETGNLPGADDNASGTAGLLELARLLGARSPAGAVQLVAFSTEEPPFFGSDAMGSAAHAQRLMEKHVPIDGMICLEMIGDFHGRQSWPSSLYTLLYPSDANFIAIASGWADRQLARNLKAAVRSAGGVAVYSFTGPHSMLDASDQRNYWSHGWPAVMVTDTAYLRNPNYHTRFDVADTLDFETMARVVDGVFAYVRKTSPMDGPKS